jgi:hypothetical protein
MVATFEGSESFADTVLPHELTHLIFREFLGFDREIPLWLSEGVAQLQEKGGKDAAVRRAKRLLADGKLLPVSDLTAINVEQLREKRDPKDFYAQAVSLTGFMLKQYGSEKFRTFCGQLRDGKTLGDALKFTYTDSVRTIEELERLWKKSLEDSNENK